MQDVSELMVRNVKGDRTRRNKQLSEHKLGVQNVSGALDAREQGA